jgi:D-apiose dehydrogenase
VQVEGSLGSVVLTHDFVLKITNREGTSTTLAAPKTYSWADPAYALIHSSIVDCNRDLLQDLQGLRPAETTGEDNFETIRLIYACYESARENRVVYLDLFR